jgi:hypothetical protein
MSLLYPSSVVAALTESEIGLCDHEETDRTVRKGNDGRTQSNSTTKDGTGGVVFSL